MQLSSEQYSYMTDYIKRQYGYSADWCKKVNKMPDDQVFAVFCSISAREKLKTKQNEWRPVKPPKIDHKQHAEQLTIWDLINERSQHA